MAIDGSSEDIGSWKTIPIRAPLRLRKPDGVSCVTSLPSKRIEPSVRWIDGGVRLNIARAVSVLPLPDSPTIPTISPALMENPTPSIRLPPFASLSVRLVTLSRGLADIRRPAYGDRDGPEERRQGD